MRNAIWALLLAASVTPALAQEKTFELKLSHWVPASHPLQKALEDWGAAVEKESGGTIKYLNPIDMMAASTVAGGRGALCAPDSSSRAPRVVIHIVIQVLCVVISCASGWLTDRPR